MPTARFHPRSRTTPDPAGGALTGNRQLKTYLRGPGRVLRSQSPDLVRQEIYGYLLTHYAVSALICRAATEADIDPDRVKFKRTVRICAAGPPTRLFSPEQRQRAAARVMAEITAKKSLNPPRRDRTYPRVVKRARHNSYRVKRPVRRQGGPVDPARRVSKVCVLFGRALPRDFLDVDAAVTRGRYTCEQLLELADADNGYSFLRLSAD